VPLATMLIKSVTVRAISQENVCCLNTALAFFVMARRDHGLAALLEVRGPQTLDRGEVGTCTKRIWRVPRRWRRTTAGRRWCRATRVRCPTSLRSCTFGTGACRAPPSPCGCACPAPPCGCLRERGWCGGRVSAHVCGTCPRLETYQKRIRDCYALEQSSCIRFAEWRATVRALQHAIAGLGTDAMAIN
jgi:hypothetical protein